jgi:hypothetical protein
MSILKYPIRQATLVLKDQRTNRQARQEREENLSELRVKKCRSIDSP